MDPKFNQVSKQIVKHSYSRIVDEEVELARSEKHIKSSQDHTSKEFIQTQTDTSSTHFNDQYYSIHSRSLL